MGGLELDEPWFMLDIDIAIHYIYIIIYIQLLEVVNQIYSGYNGI